MRKNGIQLKKVAAPSHLELPAAGAAGVKPLRAGGALAADAKLLEVAFRVAAAINASLDHNAIIETGLAQLRQFIPADSWTIYLTTQEQRRTELNPRQSGAPTTTEPSFFTADSPLGQVLQSGEPLYIKDVIETATPEPRYRRGAVRGVLCLPLVVDGYAIGVIEGIIAPRQRTTLKPYQINLAQRIADLMAIALHNATLYADVEHLCMIDDLTRLYNMRFLKQSLETEVRRAKRYHSSVALIFLDLDGFKGVNDTHGHLVGSTTLIETARIIYASVRETDFVARYGGDEFVIILPETTAERAAQIAERIRQGIEHHQFAAETPTPFRLTASFGVAAYPEHGLTSQELISRADAAMYAAKEANKNRVVRAS